MITLRDYQQDAVDSVFTYFETGASGHPLIVAPTGTGKSVIIAALIQRILTDYPTSRIVMLTHVKELIQQNLDKLLKAWPDAPVGVYSAGLRAKNTEEQILFCGIQSVWNKAKTLASAERPIEIVFIDESHRVPLHRDGTYRKFIGDLLEMNPYMRVIGLTATPFRYIAGTKATESGKPAMTGGYALLTKGKDKIFTDVAFDLTKQLVQLINDNYLSAVWPAKTDYHVNLEGIGVENGDYKNDELNKLMSGSEIVTSILNEGIDRAIADDRKHWLVFCSGIEAAYASVDYLLQKGISSAAVTGETPSKERAGAISAFQRGELTALVSVNTLTTGFDAPVTDCIIMARPTLSPILYVQTVGRGMRPTPEKIANKRGCLLLDFVGNVERHGPIDKLKLAPPKEKGKEPTKKCPECDEGVLIFARVCPYCGYEFPPSEEDTEKERGKVSNKPVILGITPLKPPVRYEISEVRYGRHVGPSGVPTLRVDYFGGFLRVASEWVCLEHEGYVRKKAKQWWLRRSDMPAPQSITDAIKAVDSLAIPTAIYLQEQPGSKYPEIVRVEFAAQSQIA